MSSAFNHKSRSRKTFKSRMAAARYNCNYNLTREERLLSMYRLRNLLNAYDANKESSEEK